MVKSFGLNPEVGFQSILFIQAKLFVVYERTVSVKYGLKNIKRVGMGVV